MSAIERYHDARRAEEQAAVQALDVLQLAVTVLAETPRYLLGEVGLDEAELREMQRLARLYADSRLLDHVATSQVIARLSEGLA